MKQRTSSRSVKLSKAFRTVDDETRRAITDQRLVALEHDNYNENEIIGDAATDDNYISDDSTAPKKKRQKKESAGFKSAGTGRGKALSWMNRPAKSFERVLMDNGLSSDLDYREKNSSIWPITYEELRAANIIANKVFNNPQTPANMSSFDPNYYSVAATLSVSRKEKSRHFCAVCGYLGDYSCVRCGARSCSLRCQTSHQETRCLNQSL